MEEIVDVLLPTYNGEKYLKVQIESILNQTYKNIRLIISDDCSKDSTTEILKEYKNKDKRVNVIIQQNNLGVVKNIEYLLKQVENKYFMLADQDDYWLPEKIEKSLEILKKEQADLVFGDLEVVDKSLNTIYPSFGKFMLLDRKIDKYINNNKLNYLYNCVTGCTILAKKEIINKVLPLPQESKYLIHDHWIGLMASLYGKVAYIKDKYIKYRQHGNNQVGTDKISHGFNNIRHVRDLFINVKLGVFGTYIKNNERFPQELQILNTEAYNYFKMLEKKKKINFRKWNIFHKLYKTETFTYYILNFIILNMPIIGAPLFKIRYVILKILKKR